MKMLNRLSFLVLILSLITLDVLAEIVVSQDKNGTLKITNQTPASKNVPRVYRRSGGITFVPPSTSSSKAPAKYLSKIKTLAKKYSLDESLIIAVARAESGFNPFAVSRKGAVGIMQLMEETALKYGVVNRYNADQNLEGGVRHLKYLYNKYNKNIPLILAAYNAGEEAVKKYKGVPPYNETRTFVKRVMNYMGMNYSNYFSSDFSTSIYQYRTKDGKIVITDTYPSNAPGPVTIIE